MALYVETICTYVCMYVSVCVKYVKDVCNVSNVCEVCTYVCTYVHMSV